MKQIQINGYKSIKELDLELTSINILIGANGGGKSNFLSFFEFLKNVYNRNLEEYVALRGGVDRFLHKGDKVTEEISTKLFFKNTNGYSFTLKKAKIHSYLQKRAYGMIIILITKTPPTLHRWVLNQKLDSQHFPGQSISVII